MKNKHLFWVIPLVFIISFVFWILMISYGTDYQGEIFRSYAGVGHTWACMDGCSNMQEIIFDDYDYFNESMKKLHHECADKCHDVYLNLFIGIIK